MLVPVYIFANCRRVFDLGCICRYYDMRRKRYNVVENADMGVKKKVDGKEKKNGKDEKTKGKET